MGDDGTIKHPLVPDYRLWEQTKEWCEQAADRMIGAETWRGLHRRTREDAPAKFRRKDYANCTEYIDKNITTELRTSRLPGVGLGKQTGHTRCSRVCRTQERTAIG